jgi:N-dimethylarginine dimethylaminohydrolase
MSSFTEYASLRKVILGRVEDYKPACWGWKGDQGVSEDTFLLAKELCNSAIPGRILEEVSEDLAGYERALKDAGVAVVRPPRITQEPIYETEYFYSYGRDLYNMRDLHLVLGKKLISCAPSQPNRILEVFVLREFLHEISNELDLELVSCPVPELKVNPLYPNIRDSLGNLVSLEDTKAPALGSVTQEIWHRLREDEILFDAANIIRYSGSALYLESSTGNVKAFEWLKSIGGEFQLHKTDVYRSSHIDSTILPLGRDTFLVNSIRVNPINLPSSIKNSRILYFDDVARIPESEIKFHQENRAVAGAQIENLGFQTNLLDMSSPWAGLNVLSLDEDTVMVDSNQLALIRFLESNKFNVIPIGMRHAYTMLGGLHCTTLDLIRV